MKYFIEENNRSKPRRTGPMFTKRQWARIVPLTLKRALRHPLHFCRAVYMFSLSLAGIFCMRLHLYSLAIKFLEAYWKRIPDSQKHVLWVSLRPLAECYEHKNDTLNAQRVKGLMQKAKSGSRKTSSKCDGDCPI